MGFVGSSEGTSHNPVGRLDGPFHLSRIHLHKQSLSHPHAPVPIPPSHVHSEHSSSCPFRLVLTRALLAATVKASNDKNVRNKLKMPHCPAMQHLFGKNLFFPQPNELCLETLRIKRLFVHSWQQTRGWDRARVWSNTRCLLLSISHLLIQSQGHHTEGPKGKARQGSTVGAPGHCTRDDLAGTGQVQV